MIRLLIIADDFTGALDTGVQFSSKGIDTRVIIHDRENEIGLRICEYENIQVLVVDAETRHMAPDDAYRKVFLIVRQAAEANIPYIYKKTDSALRGNIGSELEAMLEASGERALPFIPAFPRMNRMTVNGIHYIDRTPVSKSVFGQDPFEPVMADSVKEIIHLQSKVNVLEIRDIGTADWDEKGIWMFDSSQDSDINKIADSLKEKGCCRIMAGCAGFASALPDLLGLQGGERGKEKLEQKLLVICGSVNLITQRQLRYGEERGFKRFHLTTEEKLNKAYWRSEKGEESLLRFIEAWEKNRCCMIDSMDQDNQIGTLQYAERFGMSTEDVRRSVSETMGVLLRKLLDKGVNAILLITGGDTLLGFMREIDRWELDPVCEISPGCVLTKLEYGNHDYHVITKSGGFGDERLLESLVDILEIQK